jgi:hypothetical protein
MESSAAVGSVTAPTGVVTVSSEAVSEATDDSDDFGSSTVTLFAAPLIAGATTIEPPVFSRSPRRRRDRRRLTSRRSAVRRRRLGRKSDGGALPGSLSLPAISASGAPLSNAPSSVKT